MIKSNEKCPVSRRSLPWYLSFDSRFKNLTVHSSALFPMSSKVPFSYVINMSFEGHATNDVSLPLITEAWVHHSGISAVSQIIDGGFLQEVE